jgi:hydroxymethylpyrimidine kinase / phosphomethylpyrimidine kinase / thiamine-phosphate diphosphorylase
MTKKIALSIAGSDSSAGAGIQADLKSFTYLGVHGLTAITCVTAQNTRQVRSIYKVPAEIIEQQLESLFDDFTIDAVKTGMLYDKEIIKIVTQKLQAYHIKPVVDPVMVATSGDTLAHKTFLAALKKELLPHTLMVTANIPEAGALSDLEIIQQKDIENACKKIFNLGPESVLLKGGHLSGDTSTDFFYDGQQFHRIILPRIPQKKAHGSGCTLSALITGLLALGEQPLTAVEKAKSIVWSMIYEGYSPGKGADMLNHSLEIHVPPVVRRAGHFEVWLQLRNAIETLINFLPPQMIPEVGMNFAYGLPNAQTRDDVCAIKGRIIRQKEKPAVCGTLGFGASKHVSSIVLAAMSVDRTVRSALNMRYTQEMLQLCSTIGLTLGSFDRRFEPPVASSTMEWGTKDAITTCGYIPDIIYDTGSVGKEPMIRILGKNPEDVLKKIKMVVNALKP